MQRVAVRIARRMPGFSDKPKPFPDYWDNAPPENFKTTNPLSTGSLR